LNENLENTWIFDLSEFQNGKLISAVANMNANRGRINFHDDIIFFDNHCIKYLFIKLSRAEA